jgi:hypothetical protein
MSHVVPEVSGQAREIKELKKIKNCELVKFVKLQNL